MGEQPVKIFYYSEAQGVLEKKFAYVLAGKHTVFDKRIFQNTLDFNILCCTSIK